MVPALFEGEDDEASGAHSRISKFADAAIVQAGK
ncbi:hypothetical protein SAMN06297251_10259 [Fulvimarina manganoxydans]|uniref:Uncharacterized protein n=1 Tax=Fulvimarina manganoxydans TaxID=937218 RepID=A0A1W1YXK8_9HYPH|nr:hypothetical protein SAMN06297251_10259 [Fulvimarina manganoxydans]